MRRRRWLLAFLVAGLATACGGGDGNDTDADPYPLAVGNRWVYATTSVSGAFWQGEAVREVTGTTTIDGRAAYAIDTLSASGSPLLEARVSVARNETEVVSYGPAGDAISSAVGPRILLKLPVRVGDRWETHKTIELKFGVGPEFPVIPTQLDSVTEVAAMETVDTPRGRFRAFVVTTREQLTQPNNKSDLTTSVYYAPGVGVVKKLRTGVAFSAIRGTSETEDLLDYVVK